MGPCDPAAPVKPGAPVAPAAPAVPVNPIVPPRPACTPCADWSLHAGVSGWPRNSGQPDRPLRTTVSRPSDGSLRASVSRPSDESLRAGVSRPSNRSWWADVSRRPGCTCYADGSWWPRGPDWSPGDRRACLPRPSLQFHRFLGLDQRDLQLRGMRGLLVLLAIQHHISVARSENDAEVAGGRAHPSLHQPGDIDEIISRPCNRDRRDRASGRRSRKCHSQFIPRARRRKHVDRSRDVHKADMDTQRSLRDLAGGRSRWQTCLIELPVRPVAVADIQIRLRPEIAARTPPADVGVTGQGCLPGESRPGHKPACDQRRQHQHNPPIHDQCLQHSICPNRGP